jgi:hypothetical protein
VQDNPGRDVKYRTLQSRNAEMTFLTRVENGHLAYIIGVGLRGDVQDDGLQIACMEITPY